MASNNVVAKISADISELKTELTKGLAEFRQFGERVPKTVPTDPFKDLKAAVADLGKMAAIGTPFVAAGMEAANFDKSLRDLNKIAKLSESDLAKYAETLRTLSLDLKTTTDQTQNAAAAEKIFSAGFTDGASAMEVLRASLVAATAGGTDAGETAEFLSQQLQSYGASAKEAGRFSDVLFQTIATGITTFDELQSSLGNVSGIAHQAGISYEELGAMIATATTRGLKTSVAVDGMAQAIQSLSAGGSDAKKELKDLGLTVNEYTLKQKGLAATMLEIAEANGNSSESWKKILGDMSAVKFIQSQVSDGGELLAKSMKENADSAGASIKSLNEHNKGTIATWERFMVAAKAAGTAVGGIFLPAITKALNVVEGVASKFASSPAWFQGVVSGSVALGVASYSASKFVGVLGRTFGSLGVTLSGFKKPAMVAKDILLDLGDLAAKSGRFLMAGVSTGMMATTAAIGAGALALHEYTTILKEQNAAAADLLSVELRMGVGQRNYASLLGKTTKELRLQGIVVGDLTNSILANLERQEAAKKAGNQALLERLQRENLEIRKQREALANEGKVSKDGIDPDLGRTRAEAKARDEFNKKLDGDREKRRKEELSADLHAIDLKKKAGELSARQEIALLQQILKVKGVALKAEEKQRIEGEIAAAQGKVKADNEKRWEEATKKGAETAKKAQEAGKKAAEENFDLRQRALETDRDGKKTIEAKLEIEKQLVDLEAQKALYSEKNAKNRQAILDNAKAEKDLLDKQAADAIAKRDADLATKRADLARDTAAEEEAAQTAGFEKRRRQLDEEEARGRNVRAERLKLEDEEFKAAEKASKRRLELAKEEAAAKRKAADVDASPEQQAINAEQETLDIKKAQREAAKESQEIFDKHNASLVERLKYLREQLRLMDEAKKKERGQSFTGAAYDLDKINENLSGWGVSKSRRGTVNQDGMTASDIEQEISATEGRLGNRKEARRDHSAASSSGFGTSKWDHKRAADEKTASDVSGEYGSAISTVIGLLETIARAAGSAGNDKASSKGMGSLGVPYQLQPNSSF